MGNCMESACIIGQEEIVDHRKQEQDQHEKQEGGFDEKEGKLVRIKVVLTREELEWLVFQLEEEEEDINGTGKSSLGDVLAEIERCRDNNFRGKVVSWKPALESIMESPE